MLGGVERITVAPPMAAAVDLTANGVIAAG